MGVQAVKTEEVVWVCDDREALQRENERLRVYETEQELAGRVAVLEAALRDLRVWALEHLDALDDDVTDADEDGVLNSLRMVLEGNHGCTEQGDYWPGRWEVLQVLRALAVGDAQPAPGAVLAGGDAAPEKPYWRPSELYDMPGDDV